MQTTEELVQTLRQDIPDPNVVKLPTITDLANNLPKPKASFDNGLINVGDKYAVVGNKYVPRYNEGYIQGADNNEMYAKRQSGWEQLRNGLFKNTLKATSYVADGTIGFVAGLYNGFKEGSLEGFVNNDFSKWIDETNQKRDYQLPNFYTREQQNMNFLQSMGTMNFWANDVGNAAAFMVGAVGSEVLWGAATGGSSLALTGAKWGARLGAKTVGGVLRKTGLGAADDMLKIQGKKMLNAYARTIPNSTAAMSRIASSTSNYSNALGFLNNVRFMATSSGFEAGVEARSSIDENLESFKQMKLQTEGRLPTYDEYKEVMPDIVDSSNKVFLTNMAVLSVSNVVQFAKFAGLSNTLGKTAIGRLGSKTGEFLNKKIIGQGLTKNAEGVLEAVKGNRLQKAIGKTYGYFKNPIVEGLEEGTQGVIQRYQAGYLEGKYDPQSLKTAFDSIDLLKNSMGESFLTKEGFKEVGIGMLIGKLGNFSGGVKAGFSSIVSSGYNAQQTILEEQAKNINNKTANLDTATREAINRTLLLSQQLTSTRKAGEALEKGDDNLASVAFDSAAFSKMTAEHNAGMLDDSIESFELMVKNFKNEEFALEHGVDVSEVESAKEAIIETYKRQAEKVKEAYKFAEAFSPKIAQGKTLKEKHFIEEVAHNFFMGSQSIERLQFLGKTIEEATGQDGFADMAAYYTSLNKEQKKVVRGIDKTKNEIKNIENEYAQLQQEYSTLLEKAKRVEENVAINKQIETNRTKAEKLQNKKTDLETQKTELERQIDIDPLKKQYEFGNLFDGTFVNLDRVVESVSQIEKLDQHIAELKKINPNKAFALESLLKDYQVSHKYLEQFNKGFQDMRNPAFNFNQYKGITKWFTNPKKYQTPKNDNLTDYQKQTEEDIKANELDEYEAFQYRVLRDMSENMYNDDFAEFSYNEEIPNSEWETFKEKSEVSDKTKTDIAEKVFNKQGLTNREQRIYDKLTDDINAEVKQLKKNKGDSIRKRITKITENPELKTNSEKLKDLIKQIKESKNYLNNLETEKVSSENIPTEEEYREYNKLKDKEKLSPKKQARLVELKTKLDNWVMIEGSQLDGFNLGDLYEQLFALETLTENETEAEDFKEIVEEEDIISGETLEAQEQRWYYNILQLYDKAFIQPIVRMINGKQVPGVTLHNIGIENVVEQLLNINGFTKVAIDGKILPAAEAVKKTIKKSATIFYEKDGVEQRIDLGLNEKKDGSYGIYTTIMEDSIRKINEDSNLQIMSTTFQQNQPTVYKTLYKKLEDGTLVAIESPFERRSGENNISKTQAIKDGQEVSAKIDLGNKYNQDLIKKLRKGEITLEDFKREMVVEMVTSEGTLAGELKSEKQDDKASTHLTKFQALRQQVLDAVMEDVNNDIENLGEQIVYADNATVKVKGVYLGHPILEMKKVSENKVEVKQHQITDLDKIADTGYIENGEIKLRGKSAKDKIKKTFVHSILKGSKKFEGKRTPIVILNFKGKLVAYPVSLQATKQDFNSELQAIYTNPNTSVTEKVIAINNLLKSVNLNPNTLGVTSQDYLQKAEEIDKILTDINVYPKVETFADENLSLENILQGNATINIDLQGDMFHSPKVVLDFGKETEVENTNAEQQAEEYDETGEVYEETTLETQPIENQEEITNEEINTENEIINTENTPQPEPLQAENIQENELVEQIPTESDVPYTESKVEPDNTTTNNQIVTYSTYDNNDKPIEKRGVVKDVTFKQNGFIDTITIDFEDGKTQTIKNYTNNFAPNGLQLSENIVPLQTEPKQEAEQNIQPEIEVPQSVITKAKEEQNKKCE